MSTTYDWSPLFSGMQNLGQQLMWRKTLQQFAGPQGQPSPISDSPATGGIAGNMPRPPGQLDAEGSPLSSYQAPQAAPAQAAPAQSAPTAGSPFGGNMSKMMPFLQMMGPQTGLPLLLQMMMKQNEYDPTPRTGTNPNTGQLDQYVVNKDGTGVRWLGIKPREKMEQYNGTIFNPNEAHPGDQIGTPKPEKPLINEASGQISYDNGKTFVPIPNFIPRAAAIAGAKRADKPQNPNAPIQLAHPSSGY